MVIKNYFNKLCFDEVLSEIDIYVMPKLLLLLVIIAYSFPVHSQEYQYTPFPDSNAIWSEIYYPSDPLFNNHNYDISYNKFAIFNEDTIIKDKKYHKLFIVNDTILNRQKAEYLGAIREDSAKRIYYRGEYPFPADPINSPEDQEILVYDFSIETGDTIRDVIKLLDDDYLVVTDIDTIKSNGALRKVFNFNFPYLKWIEGIGNTRGLLWYSGTWPNDGTWNDLICFFQNDTLLYHNSDYDQCFYSLSNIDETDGQSVIKMFPNPVRDVGTLLLNSPFNYVEIYNSSGQKIKFIDVKGLNELIIYREDYEAGLYFIRVIGKDKNCYTNKFLIE